MDRNTENAVLFLMTAVALRKESVDRNTSRSNACSRCWASLSARRAWIEIATPVVTSTAGVGRSPQGERG